MRKLIVACLGLLLLLAPLAQAQFIDCSGGCSETLYGLGNDPPEGPYLHTTLVSRVSFDGHCGPELLQVRTGQIRMRSTATARLGRAAGAPASPVRARPVRATRTARPPTAAPRSSGTGSASARTTRPSALRTLTARASTSAEPESS